METSAITSATATAKKDARVGLADNFDNFLLLLTTQLQNQDPTSPMDADQFTQQLVQFSGVEQQIRANETLAELAGLLQGQQLTQSVGYLGSEVEVGGDVVRLGDDGVAKIHYELDGPATAVTVVLSDELGRAVASFPGEVGSGQHSVTWDGLGDNGHQYSDGSFKISILAETSAGEPVTAKTSISGVVDGVELNEGQTMLSVDGVLMPINQIIAVRAPTTNDLDTSA
ncbi:MAG: flagellar hook assembly protein FlgD [Geminicoccaceae bacterium]